MEPLLLLSFIDFKASSLFLNIFDLLNPIAPSVPLICTVIKSLVSFKIITSVEYDLILRSRPYLYFIHTYLMFKIKRHAPLYGQYFTGVCFFINYLYIGLR